MINRLNHAVLYVRDAERSATLYEENLGFKRIDADGQAAEPAGRHRAVRRGHARRRRHLASRRHRLSAARTSRSASLPVTRMGSIDLAARLNRNAPSSSATNEIASSLARRRGMPAATKSSVAPSSHRSNTSAVAWRSVSLVDATSSATVAMGQASA